jgi:ATP-dependent DNA helicase RecQ
VPAFVVFGNKSLQEMAREAPRTREAFATISGVGEAKFREFSLPFVDLITRYVEQHGLPQPLQPKPIPVKDSTAVSRTFLESARLVSAGASLAEVAERRGLAEDTVVGHLERVMLAGGKVEFQHLLPHPERRAAIEAAFDSLGDDLLRPVFEELRGDYSYHELRLVRLGLYQSRMAAGETGPNGPPQKRWGLGPQG